MIAACSSSSNRAACISTQPIRDNPFTVKSRLHIFTNIRSYRKFPGILRRAISFNFRLYAHVLLCCARGLPHSLRNRDLHALSFPNFSSSHQQGMNLHSKLYSYCVKQLLNRSKVRYICIWTNATAWSPSFYFLQYLPDNNYATSEFTIFLVISSIRAIESRSLSLFTLPILYSGNAKIARFRDVFFDRTKYTR